MNATALPPPGHSTVVRLIGGVRAAWTGASAGDLRPSAPGGAQALARVAAAVTGPASGIEGVHWLEQVHGRDVVTIGGAGEGEERPGPVSPVSPVGAVGMAGAVAEGQGDALVSTSPTAALAVLVADCAAVALASPEGAFAAVHAGWRGLRAGVIGAAADAMRSLGASRLVGALGPCVHPCCYEFSTGDLSAMVDLLGPAVRGGTADGRPALDLPAAVRTALARAGVEEVGGVDRCTGCGGDSFSHRARSETGRQALLVWQGLGGR